MKKRFFIIIIASLFVFSTVGAYAETALNEPISKPMMEKTKDRASRAMNNILYGPMEVPKNIDETKTKGTPMEGFNQKTRTGVERGIARLGLGLWQLATFWYSDPGCVTTTVKAAPVTTAAAQKAAPAPMPVVEEPSVQASPDIK